MTVRVLQLTDLHVLADADARLKGVPTRRTLAEVIEHLRAHEAPPDWVVLTGDLAHDERRETYAALRGLLGDWLPRCRIVPGNHDDRRAIRDVFPELVAPGDGPMPFAADAGDWRLIGLDTQAPGEIGGEVGRHQLAWLGDVLEESRDRPTVLFLHHPPVPVGSVWLDRIGLGDCEALRGLVACHPQVRLLACGHVHHEFTGRLGSATVVATPSTAIQFDPAGEEPHYAGLPPGSRIIELDGDELRTRVVRLAECRYVPVREGG